MKREDHYTEAEKWLQQAENDLAAHAHTMTHGEEIYIKLTLALGHAELSNSRRPAVQE